MPKGKKTCEKCGHQCGPRAYMCPECQLIECEKCTQKVLDDYEIVNGEFVCLDCLNEVKNE